MNPSKLVRPSNPLRSSSSAVLSFHSRIGYFPDGDKDKIRFLDNVNSSIALMDVDVPEIYTTGNPIYLRDDTTRRIIVEAYIDNDRDLASSNMVELVSKSKCCKSVNGKLGNNVVGMIPAFHGDCDGAHEICNKKTGYEMDFFSMNITMIPLCIEKHAGVRELKLLYNQIGKIEVLDKLVNLELLDLESNRIGRIEGLDSIANLKRLDLTDNQIRWIEGLDALVNLERLYLGENQIGKLEGLDNLVNLKKLNVDSNFIEHLDGLDTLVNLKDLDANWNVIDGDDCTSFKETHPNVDVNCF